MEEDTVYNVLIVGSIVAILVVTFLIFNIQTNESFTELYFESTQILPKEIELNKEYYFYFTIHNLENKDTTYAYTVNLFLDGKTIPLKQSQVTLIHDQSKNFAETFSVNEPFKEGKIIIYLLNKNQEIHFWMTQK